MFRDYNSCIFYVLENDSSFFHLNLLEIYGLLQSNLQNESRGVELLPKVGTKVSTK